MFKTMDLLNIYAILLLFASLASATPVIEKRQTARAITADSKVQSLVPLDPSQPLNPALVDLLDQYDNLQQQADSLAAGSPNQVNAVQVASVAKKRLEAKISGVASLTDSPAPTPTPEIPDIPGPTADPATVTVAPSSTGGAKAPVLTIVTHLGTSAIIVASQGRTSTVVLDPVSGASKTSGGVEATSPASNAAKSSASRALRVSVLSMATVSVAALSLMFIM